LAAEAQRLFSARDFAKAEEKYTEMLRQDEKNVYTLANLAAIQLELNRLDEAEKSVKQALAVSPEDGFSLSILGYVKFRQEKYDEALDALSRAATINPDSAEIQNYLGVTLSHKGLRGPAETALRKAITLDPTYGSAHNNLAVIYLSQQPPYADLARWHYQKARAAGHPPNAELEKLLDTKAAKPVVLPPVE
jgi:Flp pilus assembly protein TadD